MAAFGDVLKMMADRYWTNELDKQIKIISASQKMLNLNHEYFQHQLNKAILLSAIALRNCIDLSQIGLESLQNNHMIRLEYERVKNYQLRVMVFNLKDDVDLFSEQIDPEDWGKGAWTSLSAREVTNRIIHSCVWTWINTSNNDSAGFLFTSYKKKESLLFVPLDEWIKYIQEGKKYSSL